MSHTSNFGDVTLKVLVAVVVSLSRDAVSSSQDLGSISCALACGDATHASEGLETAKESLCVVHFLAKEMCISQEVI